ncbi:MAG: SDR family NAD(P)-dependent oxidoreductase, partial [Pseudomonadota bacterium]
MTPGTALVTGASKRIGRDIAVALADAGWRVGVHYNASAKDAETLAAELNTRHGGSTAIAIAADLGNIEDLDRLVFETADALGPVTALVNNASVFTYDSAQTMTADSFAAHIDVNLRGPLFLATRMADALPEGEAGAVINLLDQRVWRPTPEFFSYSLSKAALWDATRMLAQALAPAIRVNGIGPGPVLQSVHQSADEF